LKQVSRSDEFLAGPFQFQRFVDVVVGQDPLLCNASYRLSPRTVRGTLLLKRRMQQSCLPMLLLELFLKLRVLRQLRLP
jgi:hypothetical protein